MIACSQQVESEMLAKSDYSEPSSSDESDQFDPAWCSYIKGRRRRGGEISIMDVDLYILR